MLYVNPYIMGEIIIGNEKRVFKKHSAMIQVNNNEITAQERKLMNTMTFVAKNFLDSNPDQLKFSIPLGHMKTLSGIKALSNEQMKNSLRKIKKLEFEYNLLGKDKSEVWGLSSFLSEIRIISGGRGKETYVEFEFPSSLREQIKYPQFFAYLDLILISKLDSKYSIALYELLKDYVNLKKMDIRIENFKKIMGVESYTIFTMIKKRAIDPAVNEINEKTDLNVSYELIKTGKVYTNIIFRWTIKETGNKVLGEVDSQDNSLDSKLHFLGIDSKLQKTLKEKYDEDYILAQSNLLMKAMNTGKVTNPSGYLIKALEKNYQNPENEYTKQKTEKEIAKKSEENENIKKLEQQALLLQQEEAKNNEIFENYLKSHENTDELYAEFNNYLMINQSFIYKQYDGNPLTPKWIGHFKKFIITTKI